MSGIAIAGGHAVQVSGLCTFAANRPLPLPSPASSLTSTPGAMLLQTCTRGFQNHIEEDKREGEGAGVDPSQTTRESRIKKRPSHLRKVSKSCVVPSRLQKQLYLLIEHHPPCISALKGYCEAQLQCRSSGSSKATDICHESHWLGRPSVQSNSSQLIGSGQFNVTLHAAGVALRAVLRLRRVPEPDREEGPRVQLRAVRHQAVRAAGQAIPTASLLFRTPSDDCYIAFDALLDSRMVKMHLLQVYAQSNRGKEVRLVVQRLNAKRGRQEEAAERAPLTAEGPVPGAEAPRNTVGMGEDWTAYIAAKVRTRQHDAMLSQHGH